jgi:hypothetical protein
MLKKYAVHPGYISSITDGQKHYIGVSHLVRLYGVKLSDCIVCAYCAGGELVDCIEGTPGQIDLYPQYRNYSIPEVNKTTEKKG